MKKRDMYLGIIFYVNGNDDREITRRILESRKTVGCLDAVWWSQDTGEKRKHNIYDSLVKSSLLNGVET